MAEKNAIRRCVRLKLKLKESTPSVLLLTFSLILARATLAACVGPRVMDFFELAIVSSKEKFVAASYLA